MATDKLMKYKFQIFFIRLQKTIRV